MLKLVSDEDIDGDLLRGLYRRRPDLDIVRVQDVGLSATPDPEVLAWAAGEGRILLTHDRDTMPSFAYDRVRAGELMPGVFLVSDLMPVGQAIDELLLAVDCLPPDECKDFVRFFPLGVPSAGHSSSSRCLVRLVSLRGRCTMKDRISDASPTSPPRPPSGCHDDGSNTREDRPRQLLRCQPCTSLHCRNCLEIHDLRIDPFALFAHNSVQFRVIRTGSVSIPCQGFDTFVQVHLAAVLNQTDPQPD